MTGVGIYTNQTSLPLPHGFRDLEIGKMTFNETLRILSWDFNRNEAIHQFHRDRRISLKANLRDAVSFLKT
jgi:hypothetical protein